MNVMDKPVPRELVAQVLPESILSVTEVRELSETAEIGCLRRLPFAEVGLYNQLLRERGYKWTNIIRQGQADVVYYCKLTDVAREAVQLEIRDLGLGEPPLSLTEHLRLATYYGVSEELQEGFKQQILLLLREQGNTCSDCRNYTPGVRAGFGECAAKGVEVEGTAAACADSFGPAVAPAIQPAGTGEQPPVESSPWVTEQVDEVEMAIEGEDGNRAKLLLPGFDPIPVQLDVINDWIEQQYGMSDRVRPYSTGHFRVNARELYTFLEGPGVDVNDYVLHKEIFPSIASSDDLEGYFAKLDVQKQVPAVVTPLESEEKWVVFAVDGSFTSNALPKSAAIELKKQLMGEGPDLHLVPEADLASAQAKEQGRYKGPYEEDQDDPVGA